MKNRLVIGLFCALALTQIAMPLSMIIKREQVIKTGQQYKFKTQPVDPFDAFRGRYVSLSLEEENILFPEGGKFKAGQKVYAHISVDEQGFAKLSTLTRERPDAAPYITVKIKYIYNKKAHLDLPIKRYYMEEKSAPLAEKIYRAHSRQDKKDAYVSVRIKDGFAVVEQLYVGGQRIEDAVK